MGKLRPTKNKSDILRRILPVSPVTVNKSPTVDAKILVGAVIVNMLHPRECKTFEQYSQKLQVGKPQENVNFKLKQINTTNHQVSDKDPCGWPMRRFLFFSIFFLYRESQKL